MDRLNPFNDHSRSPMAYARRAQSSPRPRVASANDVEPKIDVDTQAGHYVIKVAPPHATAWLSNVRAMIGRFQLRLTGHVETRSDSLYTYQARRPVPVYDDL